MRGSGKTYRMLLKVLERTKVSEGQHLFVVGSSQAIANILRRRFLKMLEPDANWEVRDNVLYLQTNGNAVHFVTMEQIQSPSMLQGYSCPRFYYDNSVTEK